jgi:hypothetical protein
MIMPNDPNMGFYVGIDQPLSSNRKFNTQRSYAGK